MKIITILLAALIPFSAQAGVLAKSNNAAGGEIILTLEQGDCEKNEYIALSVAGTGEVITGCWRMVDVYVAVKWNNGTVRMYQSSSFVTTDEYNPKDNDKHGRF